MSSSQLVKSSASGLGFSAGLIIWQALVNLSSLRRHSGSIGVLPGVLMLLAGFLSTYLLQHFVVPLALTSGNPFTTLNSRTCERGWSAVAGLLHTSTLCFRRTTAECLQIETVWEDYMHEAGHISRQGATT